MIFRSLRPAGACGHKECLSRDPPRVRATPRASVGHVQLPRRRGDAHTLDVRNSVDLLRIGVYRRKRVCVPRILLALAYLPEPIDSGFSEDPRILVRVGRQPVVAVRADAVVLLASLLYRIHVDYSSVEVA